MQGKLYKLSKDIRRDWQLYLFLLLPLAYILIFSYIPMGGLVIAFEDYSVRKGIFGSEWVGLENFKRFFESYQCGRVIKNTLILSSYSIIAGFPLPICFALMLNSVKNEKFKKVTQTIVNLPAFYLGYSYGWYHFAGIRFENRTLRHHRTEADRYVPG